MREFGAAVATTAAALALVAAVVFGARDTSLFVPPPEAVAEEFAGKLASARYELAVRHLASSARHDRSAQEMEKRFEPVRRAIGALNRAEADGSPGGAATAFATCELQGEAGTAAVRLVLRREQGLWKVESWDAAATISR